MEETAFTPALLAMDGIYEGRKILSKPFLEVCKSILPIIDKFSEASGLPEIPFKLAMEKVKTDIDGNIKWLEAKYNSSPTEYNQLYSMIEAEVLKTPEGSCSIAVGLLWLTRAMDFLVQLFRNLLDHPHSTLSKACTDSYNQTLGKWHNMAASTLFWAAMQCAPNRKKFMKVIGGAGDLKADIEKFCSTIAPILEENHKFLKKISMDNLKA